MSEFKLTFFFKDTVNLTGWTENWYVTAADAPTAIGFGDTYVAARTLLLLDTTKITQIRASVVDAARDSLYATLSSGNQGTIVTATYPSAGVWDCLLVSLQSAIGTMFGHVFLHQVPAFLFTGRDYAPGGAGASTWNANIAAWEAEIVTLNFGRKLKGPLYVLVAHVVPIRRTERKLGRPFDALRGRRLVA